MFVLCEGAHLIDMMLWSLQIFVALARKWSCHVVLIIFISLLQLVSPAPGLCTFSFFFQNVVSSLGLLFCTISVPIFQNSFLNFNLHWVVPLLFPCTLLFFSYFLLFVRTWIDSIFWWILMNFLYFLFNLRVPQAQLLSDTVAKYNSFEESNSLPPFNISTKSVLSTNRVIAIKIMCWVQRTS